MLLVGPPVEALREWLERADIKEGPIFRAIDRWEAVEEKALTPQSINLIVKRRCAMAGPEPEAFSAHGLRAEYLTKAARHGVSPARSHAAVPASVGPTAGQLLQRSRTHERQGHAAGYLIARGVTRVAPGPPMTMVAGSRYHSLERLSGASRRGPLPVKSCELARLDLLWVASRRGASDVTSH